MGRESAVKVYRALARRRPPPLPAGMAGLRLRTFAEWKALRRWAKLPAWEVDPAGYLLRFAREEAGLSQSRLAARLGCSQQAVAQAERWNSNPTIAFMRRWVDACGRRLSLALD